mgnify:FL=1|tara:strand:- start:1446 stop:2111 length:666 start_codon:yes stop_codon:yes gene_type:complete
MNITLLCRGKSLGWIQEIPKVDHCVLVNSFHYELENPKVHEYVSACSKVSHVLSLGAYFPKSGAKEIYKKYNFKEIVLPYIKEVSPPIPRHLRNIEGKSGIIPVKNMGDINKKNMISHPRYAFTSPTCGLDALLYTVNELKPDIVNIVGLDFYDKVGYLTNSNGRKLNEAPDDIAIKWGESTQKMQEFFINFVKDNLDTQFNLYTLSNINFTNPNLNTIKV